jgi:calcium-dependent protein kinase
MGSSCSKTPVVVSNRKKKTISSFSKINDYKKKYEYVCILGNGAFGKVRLYRDKSCKSMKFAIKTIKKEGLYETMRNCILEEVNILRELDHPNIIKYYETYEDDFYIHIVMEYLQGEDLFKVITNRKYNNYSEKDAAEIIKQLLKAVIFIHNKKIVHRDIKPENILFSVSGDYTSLKLIDFGLSTHHFTKKQVVGSPYYMAPEIIDGNYSFKTDNWSIGVILYVLMTGKYPYTGEDQKTVFNKIRYENFNVKDLQASKCSKEVKNLISKLLIKDVKDRLSIEDALEHPWFKLWDDNIKDETLPLLDTNIVDSIKEFTNKNCFHKEVMFYIAKLSRDEEVAKLKETFIKLDKDHTGTLTYDEIFKGFEEIGLKVNRVIENITMFKINLI